MKHFILFAAMALTISVTGCKGKKTPDPIVPAKTKTELLTQSSWKLTAVTVNPTYNGFTEYSQMATCDTDNIYIFNTGGVLTLDEGASKCNPGDPQTGTDIWVFKTNETIITIGSLDHTILELTETILKESYVSNSGGVNYTVTETYSH
jgi:hypothetical protein